MQRSKVSEERNHKKRRLDDGVGAVELEEKTAWIYRPLAAPVRCHSALSQTQLTSYRLDLLILVSRHLSVRPRDPRLELTAT
jgi:hypothetical protein